MQVKPRFLSPSLFLLNVEVTDTLMHSNWKEFDLRNQLESCSLRVFPFPLLNGKFEKIKTGKLGNEERDAEIDADVSLFIFHWLVLIDSFDFSNCF